MEMSGHFDVTDAAVNLLEKQFQDKEVVLVYENLTHDGGDEQPSDIYHLYIFTLENGCLHYYTTSYEKRHVPSDTRIYPPVNGMQIDNDLPRAYLNGIRNRVSTYFEFIREHPQVKFVLDWLEKTAAEVTS